MNSKHVLSKIAKLLNLEAEVELTYAKLADGTIVESATFDVGEDLFVVSEDGTKTPAPNGTHELMLRDTEGNETLLKVITEDGKIVERENVELEIVETKQLEGDPGTGYVDPTVEKEEAAGKQVKDLKPSSMLAEVEPTVSEDETTEEVESIPADTDKEEMGMPEMLKKIEDMAYRIEEMEKKISKMAEVEIEIKGEEKEDVEEEELPKLDGAPIEEGFKFSAEQNNKRFGKKTDNAQNTFLSKLYK